jgi:hypothetical protein
LQAREMMTAGNDENPRDAQESRRVAEQNKPNKTKEK